MKRRLTSLGDLKWEALRVDKKTGQPAGNPFPCKVPGDIISDLAANGMIDDPYRGMNSLKCRWINRWDWLYRAKFPGRCPPGERRFIRFMGVDYEAWFRLNGRLLGAHEGMFSRVVFEITSVMEDENELEVLLIGQKDSALERLGLGNVVGRTEGRRVKTLKSQYSFGWDFAPSFKGAGIWDDVWLHSTGPVALDDIWLTPDVKGAVHLKIDLSSRASGKGRLEWSVQSVSDGEPVARGSEETDFSKGPQRIDVSFIVEAPRLWNSWDMGEPFIYRLIVEAFFEGERSDSIADAFGFRSIGFEGNAGAPKGSDPWTLVLNGRRLFMRGVNWVPLDSLLARVTTDRYRSLLESARDMGANLIRVWGGGLREKRAFYDICDELGLLVWQEFPLACAFMRRYPRSQWFKNLLASETGDIIRQLRNHPSLAIWCGANEIHVGRNRSTIELMGKQVEMLDGTRRFHPSSPSRGDAHNWLVWHGKGNLEDYLDERGPLISEFGLQALPSRETLEWMFDGDALWPPDKKAWEHHNIEWDKMNKYALAASTGGEGVDRRFMDKMLPSRGAPPDFDLNSYIEATQRMQAHVLKTAVERWRRMKFSRGGVAVWQFNEPWPSICWSLVDYFGRPKPAYYALKMSMAPLMVALYHPLKTWRSGDRLPFDIAVVNDTHRDFGMTTAVVSLDGKDICKKALRVKPNCVVAAEDLSVAIGDISPRRLTVQLLNESGAELAHNEHDLTIHDPKRANPLVRLFFKSAFRWVTKERERV